MISTTDDTPAKRLRCDKCGMIVNGGRRILNKHKREHHSY